MKDEFVCTNEIFLIFKFLVRWRPKFSTSIYASLRENSILHLLLFFFHFEDEFFIRKILIYWILLHNWNFFLIFQLFLPSQMNSLFKCRIVWNKIQFFIYSFSSFYVKDKFFIRKILIFSTVQWYEILHIFILANTDYLWYN